MKLYDETVRCDVRLPDYAVKVVDREAKRTGIQRAVFLRSVILHWIEKEYGTLPDPHLGDSSQAATSTTPEGVTVGA